MNGCRFYIFSVGFSKVSYFFCTAHRSIVTDSSGVVWSKFKSSVVVKMTRGAGREITQNTLALCQQTGKMRMGVEKKRKKKRASVSGVNLISTMELTTIMFGDHIIIAGCDEIHEREEESELH